MWGGGTEYINPDYTLGVTVAYAADTATGTGDGVAQGTNSVATTATDTAVGKGANASGKGSTAIGNNAKAYRAKKAGDDDPKATIPDANAVAVGNGATASDENAVAIGTGAKASHINAVAVGKGAAASQENAVSFGVSANATGKNSGAIGSSARAAAENASAFGFSSKALGLGSVALGVNSTSNTEGTVALGRDSFADGKSSIAIGNHAWVKSNGYSLTSIAIGNNSYVLNGTGQQEYEFSFNKNDWIKTPNGFLKYKYDPKAGSDALDRLPGGIAIGTNAYARTGSIEIGSHTMQGKPMAGIIVEGSSANIIDMTTIGTNSYNKGMMATIVGAYSINTGDFDGSGGWNSLSYGSQNMGSVLIGSLNQNRSKGKGSSSGVANSIVGVANIAENANGALIYGAGNKITNSVASIGFDGNYGANTVDELLEKLSKSVQSSNGGGATMAFGGGNVADYTNLTMITGVNNTVKGTEDKISKRDSVMGYNNTVTNASDVKLIGNNNTIEEDASDNMLFGDNYTIKSGKTKNVILGSAANNTELTVSSATILGYNANVKAEGGVALGFGSILSDTESNLSKSGWDVAKGAESTETGYIWRPTHAAVSVGVSGTSTRRITNVAAGFADTDAVNVAQLKKAVENAGSGTGGSANLVAGDGIKLVKGSDGSWTISTNFEKTGSDEVTYKDSTSSTDTDNTTGKAAQIETKLTADDGKTTSLGKDGKLGIKGDDPNISTSVSGSDVKVSLNKDIKVDSVTIHNGGPTMNSSGLNMNNTKITNLADGDVYEGSHDAVTGGQLWNVEQSMNGRMSNLDTKINRVGAGAAAMANLHPLEFDPDDKWSFSAGFGNYRNANAMAMGAFYRPNENTMFNVSGTFGNGENMIGAGVSFKFGQSSKTSRFASSATISELQATVQAQNEKIEALEKLVQQLLEKK